jgi:hypothetical protein
MELHKISQKYKTSQRLHVCRCVKIYAFERDVGCGTFLYDDGDMREVNMSKMVKDLADIVRHSNYLRHIQFHQERNVTYNTDAVKSHSKLPSVDVNQAPMCTNLIQRSNPKVLLISLVARLSASAESLKSGIAPGVRNICR